MEGRSRKHLIRGAFLRLMINNMLLLIAVCACGLIDNLFIGRTLGKDALAAVGFFSPVTVAIGFCYVVILGAQMLTGNLVGEGKIEKVNRLFMSAIISLTVVFSIFSVCCIVFDESLATLLGADGKAHALLCKYIKGYAPGILPQTLSAMLMALCAFNNALKRSYWAIAAMIIANTLGDILLIGRLGLFGVGLTSSISSLASFLVLLPAFCRKDKLFRFSLNAGFSMKLVMQACARGLPSLMLSAGVIIKNYCFNYAMNHYAGAAGVAVVGIMATVSSLTGTVPSGCYNAFSALAGIYYGEEDRESMLDLARIALRIGVVSCAAVTCVIMLLSLPLSTLFFPNEPDVQPLAQRMFMLTFTYLVPCVIFNIFLQTYRAQNRMLLVNIMSFAETAVIGLFTLLTINPLGSDAAWISNAVVDVLCICVVLISVVFYKKKLDFSMPALLKLPDDFGTKVGDCMTFSVTSLDDVTMASEKVIAFCLDHGFSDKMANHVGLCIEEMAVNVIVHGFKDFGIQYADIRAAFKNGGLTVRVRDNCHEFDPRKRMELLDPMHPEKNIGIRIVTNAARQVDYYNNAGINTLIMKF